MFGWVKKLFRAHVPQTDTFWQDWWKANTSGGGLDYHGLQGAVRYPPVWQALSLISGDIAKLPIYIGNPENKTEDWPFGEPYFDHPLYGILAEEPRPGVDAFQSWRRFMNGALYENHGFYLIDRDGIGEVRALLEVEPWAMRFDYVNEAWIMSSTQWGSARLDRMDVFHVEGPNITETNLMETSYSARRSWALGLAAEDFASQFFARGGKHSGILEMPPGMSKTGRDRFREDFKQEYEQYGTAFSTIVLPQQAKWHSTQVTPVDAELSQLREDQVADTARYFNLPPEKLGLPVNVSYASLLETNKAYLGSTLSPWLHAIQSEASLKLLTREERRRRDVAVIHDLRPLLMPAVVDEFDPNQSTRQPRPNEAEAETDTVME